MALKTCTKCGETKVLEGFFKHPTGAQGRQSWCKVCENAKKKAWLKTPSGSASHRAATRKWRAKPESKEIQRKATARWRTTSKGQAYLESYEKPAAFDWRSYHRRNPEKAEAHRLFGIAKLLGKIRTQPCVKCQSPRADGHHEDYSKPYDVVWLCRRHHKQRHRMIDMPLPDFLKAPDD